MEIRLYASMFIVNEKEEVLFVREGKETMRDRWNFPGGHMEEGETPEIAAIREAREETGIVAVPSHLMKVFLGKHFDSFHFLFLSKTYSGNIHISDPNILEAKWIPIADLKKADPEQYVRSYKIREACHAYETGKMPEKDVLSVFKG